MSELQIVDWINYEEAEALGYRDADSVEAKEFMRHEQLVVDSLRRNGYKFTGFYHQNGEHGVPLFNDGMVYRVSQRVWGGIMAEALGLDLSNRMSYLAWYYIAPDGEEQIVPEAPSQHHSILFN